MEMTDLVGATGGVAFVMAATAFAKLIWPRLPGNWLPLIALSVGIGLQLVLAAYFGLDLLPAAIWGMVSAFIASGVWSQGKSILERAAQ